MSDESVNTSAKMTLTDDQRKLAEYVAKHFHDIYERLAPEFGWETQEQSRTTWESLPPQNRELMIAVAGDLLRRRILPTTQWHCADMGPHDNPSPSHCEGALCNTCSAFVPLHHFKPIPEGYLTDTGRRYR